MFLSESVTEYVISYTPSTLTSTSPVTISLLAMSLSSVSVTVTPAYLSKLLPRSIVTSSAPDITGLSLLTTFTVIVFLTVSPSSSVTSYVTLYSPTLFVSTVSSITTILLDISPSSLSLAVTSSLASNDWPTFISL